MTFTSSSPAALRAGLATVVLLGLTACGGIADDAPDDADPKKFCNAYFDEDKSAADVADELADIGTPDDISSDERHGFELYVEALEDEGDKANKDVDSVQIPADDKADGTAFVDYAGELCPPLLTTPAEPTDGVPSETPSTPEPGESTS